MEHKFDLIAALDLNRGIGKNGKLPWSLKADMRHFKELTTNARSGLINVVIVGRKTWESIPKNRRPLKDRLNVVLTTNKDYQLPPDVLRCNTLVDAWQQLEGRAVDECFIAGGANLYAQCINHPSCNNLYLTEIEAVFDCDVFFPEFQENYLLVSSSDVMEENGLKYCFKIYRHANLDYSRNKGSAAAYGVSGRRKRLHYP